jgi:hypothetical protein
VKVVRNIPRYIESAEIEAKILAKVYKKQKEFNTDWCMKMYSHFYYQGKMAVLLLSVRCLVVTYM